MEKRNQAGNLLPMQVTEGVTVSILPNPNHEFLMTTKEVAYGYGTSDYAIRQAMSRNSSELIEGKHIIKGCDILSNPFKQPHQVFWTKRGIVRLGFFIKSNRARLFRDWAEELVIDRVEQHRQGSLFPVPVPSGRVAVASKRNHNRLTSDRLLSIMADVCQIEDKALRLSISNKLMMGGV